MDQLTLFGTEEAEAYARIRSDLEQVVIDKQGDISILKLERRKAYHSVTYDKSLVVRIRGGRRPYIEYPTRGRTSLFPEIKDKYIKTYLETLSEIDQFLPDIIIVLNSILDDHGFDCCSRYMECSDALACVNPYSDLRPLCRYKRILESGRVFYGKNRNI